MGQEEQEEEQEAAQLLPLQGEEGGRHANAICYRCYQKGNVAYSCKVKRSQLKCDFCKTTGKHVSNNYCKEKSKVKSKDDKEVAKKEDSTKGVTKTPAGTLLVSDSEGDDDHSGQAVYH